MQLVGFVMHVNLASTHVFLLLDRRLAPQFPLNSFIVMSGHLLCLACLGLNIILSSLMILPIIAGRTLSGINQKSINILLTLLPMLTPNSVCLSAAFRPITAPSSSITPPPPSLLAVASCSAPRALTPPRRTAKLNGCFGR